jgi:Tfp pilus assembly protein PilO
MRQSSNAVYSVTMILIIVIGSFLYSWKVIIPKYQKNKLELTKLEQEVVSANAKLDSLRVAKQDIADLGLIFNQLFVAMPKDKDEPNTISEIEAMATLNKLTLPNIQISDTSSADTTGAASSTVKIAFSVTGTFENVQKLITALQKDLKFINIKSTTLSASDQGISASFQIEGYKIAQTASLLSTTASATSSTDTLDSSGGQ